jgi:hypothetical protein
MGKPAIVFDHHSAHHVRDRHCETQEPLARIGLINGFTALPFALD